MRFTAAEVDELLSHPKPTLEERRYDLRRDYETWFSDKNKVPDSEAWLLENLIERQKEYFLALAASEDEKKEMPTSTLQFHTTHMPCREKRFADVRVAQNLYQKKDMLEWWNLKLCDEFDTISNTWLLDLDAYIDQLSIEHELQSSV